MIYRSSAQNLFSIVLSNKNLAFMSESSSISNKGKSNMASDADDSPVVPIRLVGTTSQESTIPDLLYGTPSCGSIQNFLNIKLTSTNYLFWKMQFTPLINCFCLQSFIDKTLTPPTPSITCPKYMVLPFGNLWKSLLAAPQSQ